MKEYEVSWDIKLKNNHIIIGAAFLLIIASVWRIQIVSNAYPVRAVFHIFFQLSVVVLFAGALWGTGSKWWALFLLLALHSTFSPVTSRYSLGAFNNILLGCLWFLFLVTYLKDNSVKYLLDAICIIALANVAFLIVQYLNIDPLWVPKTGTDNPPVGLMANPNEVSALLAFCFPAFLRGRWKWVIPAIILGLVLAHSFAGPLAVGIGGIVYLGAKKKLLLSIALVSAGLLLFYFFVDKPSVRRGRLKTYKLGLHLTAQHWVTGYGIGHWGPIISAVQKKQGQTKDFMRQAHNEYVQMFFEMGIGFLIIVAGYFISIIRRFKVEAIIPIVAVVIIAVNSVAFFPFHIATTAMIAITWMAILECKLNER